MSCRCDHVWSQRQEETIENIGNFEKKTFFDRKSKKIFCFKKKYGHNAGPSKDYGHARLDFVSETITNKPSICYLRQPLTNHLTINIPGHCVYHHTRSIIPVPQSSQ